MKNIFVLLLMPSLCLKQVICNEVDVTTLENDNTESTTLNADQDNTTNQDSTTEIINTTEAPCFIEKEVKPECYYLEDLSSNKLELFKRCLKIKSPKLKKFSKKSKTVFIDSRKCGVTNETNVKSSEICFSELDSIESTKILQELTVVGEPYKIAYSNPESNIFQAKKLELEQLIGKKLLSHDAAWGFNFESALIISMKNSEIKNEILVSMVVQFFHTSTIQTEVFGENWENMIQAEEKLKVLVKSEKNTTKNLEYCPKLSTLKPKMHPEIWTASKLGENDVLKVGEVFNLKCPEGWKLSYDNDTFNAWDDLFTVSCTPLKLYSEFEYWPSCVKSCKVCLPEPPKHTGLLAIPPKNTIPIGGYGLYICDDQSLGVDASASEYFNVNCIEEDTYYTPENFDWPICMSRTTTVNPVIPKAFNQTLYRRVMQVDSGLVDENKFVDISVQLDQPANNFFLVTFPSFLGLSLLICILILIVHIKSPIFNICKEFGKSKDKYVIQMDSKL